MDNIVENFKKYRKRLFFKFNGELEKIKSWDAINPINLIPINLSTVEFKTIATLKTRNTI